MQSHAKSEKHSLASHRKRGDKHAGRGGVGGELANSLADWTVDKTTKQEYSLCLPTLMSLRPVQGVSLSRIKPPPLAVVYLMRLQLGATLNKALK